MLNTIRSVLISLTLLATPAFADSFIEFRYCNDTVALQYVGDDGSWRLLLKSRAAEDVWINALASLQAYRKAQGAAYAVELNSSECRKS